LSELILTAYDGAILGPIAKFLGWIMNWIYLFFSDTLGIENVALTIIVFTIFIYLCLFPITYKQQKFAMLSRKMQPELSEIQKKYKDKKDQASMTAMQEETQKIYDKYGVSPSGTCVYALIQMPILFALYRVFYNVPAYISSVKGIFTDLVSGITATDGYVNTMQTIYENSGIKNVNVDFTSGNATASELKNYVIDVVYKLSDSGWDSLADAFPNLTDVISSTHAQLDQVNYFGLLNISDTPLNLIKTSFSAGAFGVLACALLIPVVSYLTQVINVKMMPTNTNGTNDQMAQQMKTMNLLMPLMSFVICFTVPVGLGIYWIAGAVIRSIQQFFLNKHFNKLDLDEIIEKNKEKAEKKAEKRGIRRNQITQAANINTRRTMSEKANISSDKIAELDRANELRNQAKKGSMADKANMVTEFNNRNNK